MFRSLFADTCQNSSIFSPFGALCGPFPLLRHAFKIREAFHVVNQVQESYLRRGPQPPDTLIRPRLHEFYLSKHMFYARSLLLISSGSGQLHFRQRRSTSPLTHICFCTRDNPVVFRLFRGVCAVGKHIGWYCWDQGEAQAYWSHAPRPMSLHSRE